MALLRIDHKPETLKLNVPLYLIVPDPGKIGSWPLADRPVLYLLHGLSEDGSAWVRHTEIETLAEDLVSCGRQDDLYPLSIQFREACRSARLPLVYHEEDGGHHWPFWNRQLGRFLEFAREQVGG